MATAVDGADFELSDSLSEQNPTHSPAQSSQLVEEDDGFSPPRSLRIYPRPQLLALSKSPLICVPPNMPELKEWFGFVSFHFSTNFRFQNCTKGRKMSKISQRRTPSRQHQTVAVNDGEFSLLLSLLASLISPSGSDVMQTKMVRPQYLYSSGPSSQLFCRPTYSTFIPVFSNTAFTNGQFQTSVFACRSRQRGSRKAAERKLKIHPCQV